MREASNFRHAIKVVICRHADMPAHAVESMADDVATELMRLATEPAAYNVAWDGELTTNIYLTEEDARAAMKRLNEKFPSDKREIVPLYHAPISKEVHARMMVAKSWLNSPAALGDVLSKAGVDLAATPESVMEMLGDVAAEVTIHVCEQIAGLKQEGAPA